jgi:hypothetical protein
MCLEKGIDMQLCLISGNFKLPDEHFDEKVLLNCQYCEFDRRFTGKDRQLIFLDHLIKSL